MELNQQVEQMNREWNEFKAVLAAASAEEKKNGKMLGDTNAKLDLIGARLDQLEVKLQRPAGGKGRETMEVANEAHTKAFNKFVRYGEKNLTPDEVKVLTISNDPSGGFGAAPDEFDLTVLKGIIDLSPVRDLVKVRTTASRSFKYMKRTGTFAARRTNEVQTRTETTGYSLGLEEVPTYELYAMVDIARQDLEDSGFDLVGELTGEFSEQFAVKEGAEFVNGDPGLGQFEGILTNAAISYDPTTDANLLTYDGLVSVSHNVKAGYLSLAPRYIFNLKTLGAIRKIKDTTNQPVWAPMQAGAPANIFGFEYTLVPDMPDVAANNFPVAFGAWKRAYVLGDRIQQKIVRDDVTQLTAGAVRFYSYKRNGGQVVVAEGIRKLKISVS